MFKKKKLYKVVYRLYTPYTTIVAAKDEVKALKKFKKEVPNNGIRPTIISFEEYRP